MAKFETLFDAESLKFLMTVDYGQAVGTVIKMLSVRKAEKVEETLRVITEAGMDPWAVAFLGTPTVAEKLRPLGVLPVVVENAQKGSATFTPTLRGIEISGVCVLNGLRDCRMMIRSAKGHLQINHARNVVFPLLESAENIDAGGSDNVEMPALAEACRLDVNASTGFKAVSLRKAHTIVAQNAKSARFPSLRIVSGFQVNHGTRDLEVPMLQSITGTFEGAWQNLKDSAEVMLPALRVVAERMNLHGFPRISAPNLEFVGSLAMDAVQGVSYDSPDYKFSGENLDLPSLRTVRDDFSLSQGSDLSLESLSWIGGMIRCTPSVSINGKPFKPSSGRINLPNLVEVMRGVTIFGYSGFTMPNLERITCGHFNACKTQDVDVRSLAWAADGVNFTDAIGLIGPAVVLETCLSSLE